MSVDILSRKLATLASTNATSALTNANVAYQRASSVDLFTRLNLRTIDSTILAIITSGQAVSGLGAGTYVNDAKATAALAAAFPALCAQSADGRYWRAALDPNGGLNVDAAGARGDGVTNDAAAIGAARDYVIAVGGWRVKFTAGKTYLTNSTISCGSNITWDFNGATLTTSSQIVVFGASFSTYPKVADVPSDIWGPTNKLPVSSTDSISVGDYLVVRLGNNPWDNIEPIWATTCQVLAVDTTNKILTLDGPSRSTSPLPLPVNILHRTVQSFPYRPRTPRRPFPTGRSIKFPAMGPGSM